jgi:hypothetical protein
MIDHESESRASHAASAQRQATFDAQLAALTGKTAAVPHRGGEAATIKTQADAALLRQADELTKAGKHAEAFAMRQRAFEAGANATTASTREAAPAGFEWQNIAGREMLRPIVTAPVAEIPQGQAAQLAWVDRVQAMIDPKTGKRFYDDPATRAKIEETRARVFNGEDIAETIRLTEAARRGEKPTETVEPQGNPADRAGVTPEALAAIVPGLDVRSLPAEHVAGLADVVLGGVVELARLPAAATSGYKLDHLLTEDYGLSETDIADLRAARAAGLTQRQVEAFVSQRLAEAQ